MDACPSRDGMAGDPCIYKQEASGKKMLCVFCGGEKLIPCCTDPSCVYCSGSGLVGHPSDG